MPSNIISSINRKKEAQHARNSGILASFFLITIIFKILF